MECCCGICLEETPADQLLRFCDGGKHCFCRECFGSYKTKSSCRSDLSSSYDDGDEDHQKDEYDEYDMHEDMMNRIPCPVCRKPIEFLEDARFTGKLEGFYRNGGKKWEIEYKDGWRDGLMQIWADNGVLYKKLSYVRGLKEGPYQTFRIHSHRDLRLPGDGSLVSEVTYITIVDPKFPGDGSLVSEGTHLASVKEGEEIEWYPHGWIKARRVYVNGLLDGPTVSYYNKKYGPDGYPIDDGSPQKVMTENYYINGLLNGTSITYDEDGKIHSMGEYIDGMMNGVHKKWYKDGTLKEETHYQLRQKSGEWRMWYPNGQIGIREFYENDHLMGDYEEWWEDGTQRKKCSFKMGKCHGPSLAWHPNGSLYFESNYVDGKKEGEEKIWWDNGVQKSIANYSGGKMSGPFYRWEKDGRKMELLLFDGSN